MDEENSFVGVLEDGEGKYEEKTAEEDSGAGAGAGKPSPADAEALAANLARVEFRAATAKDIVSPHSGSILARDGPVVPLAGALLDRTLGVFDSLAPAPEEPEEGEEAPRVPFSAMSQALFDCRVCPVDLAALPEPEQEPEPEPQFGEDGELLPQHMPAKLNHPLVDRLSRLLGTLSAGEEARLGPSHTLDRDGFAYFVGKFYAPQFHYGQRMRRAAGRDCISDVLDLLLRGIDCNCGDGEGLTTLHYAAEFNRCELIEAMVGFCEERLLLNPRCKAGWTPLYAAAHHNNPEVVSLLLQLGADHSTGTVFGKSPLHAAAGQGFSDICTILLEAGADPNQQCSSGMTALHDAAYKENNACYTLLGQWEGTNSAIKENLRYTAEKLLCGYTGTNNDGSISYSGSSVAGDKGEPSGVLSMTGAAHARDADGAELGGGGVLEGDGGSHTEGADDGASSDEN